MNLFKNFLTLLSLGLIFILWVGFTVLMSFVIGANHFFQFYAFFYGVGLGLMFLLYPKLKKIINSLFT